MRTSTASAHARVGFLGNPSDIYGGKGIGFGIADLGVDLELSESRTVELPNDLLLALVSLFAEEEQVVLRIVDEIRRLRR